ncbi:glycosyltransferase family 4 protein [Brachybacterium sp. YJGR34]|uniref:glycosyltransferase family 4 protein n=1 Tax=Brachybacterium sp. YJGR34 TaxID=2059911 RepID=UPI000E0A9899|nr:glycosyltransferase family 4 protein [Brachybacterium sp. YJGR34]
MSGPTIAIATNQGTLGGGEVMLLSIAAALEELGHEVLVIGPAVPGDLLDQARSRGLRILALPGASRRRYAAALLAWRLRHRGIPLWCNGLLPSLATAGLGPRIVHLHRRPTGAGSAAARLAGRGARWVLVPSEDLARAVPGARVLPNWTEEIPRRAPRDAGDGPLRVGFLGRLTREKGADLLLRAMAPVIARSERGITVVLAGENRFGRARDDAALAAALAPVAAHVERPGWIARDAFLADVDLVVVPSRGPESFGLVVAEAMAAGVPVVVTDAGALGEVVGPEHPWIARRDDAADLAAVIERALSEIAAGDEQRAARARRRWEAEYSPAAGSGRVAALLGSAPAVARPTGEEAP